MINNSKKTDADLKSDVLSELKYEPTVKVTDIGVLVNDGTVTLNGFATSYSEKSGAVRAAKRVAGVNSIADEIVVRLPGSHHRTDADIAHAAIKQIEWCTTVPVDQVVVTVCKGWITLEGNLEWYYLRHNAEKAVHNLAGVTGVSNHIKIAPTLTPMAIQDAITAAFLRNADLDAAEIQVTTDGTEVTLSGKARNHAERDEAERTAWAAPGVCSVVNDISVKWGWFA